jgi:hypothetical protein
MDNAFRVVLLICAVGSAFGTYRLGSSGETGAAVTMATLAAILCAFAFLTKFKRFKGLGFEGELWEQEMEQAAELRRGLQGLAEQLGESLAWQMAAFGSWGGEVFHEKRAIVGRMADKMKEMGIAPARIDELNRTWHKMVMTELARPIAECVRRKLTEKMAATHEGITSEKKKRMIERPNTEEKTPREAELEARYHSMDETKKKLYHPIIRHDYEHVPRYLREFIDQSPWLTPEDRKAIYRDCAEEFSDVDQYARERTIRRPDVLK